MLALPVVTLTATFKTKTTVSCHEINETEDNNSYTIVYKSDFPYDYLRAYRDGDYLGIIEFDKDYGAIAQSFLAWGIITLIYCILAIFLYMMLSESQQWKYFERTTNIIYVAVSVIIVSLVIMSSIIQDFGGSILWAIFWLAICVAWTIGSIQFEDFVKDHSHCVDDILYTGNRDDASFAQTYVAIVSGFFATCELLNIP